MQDDCETSVRNTILTHDVLPIPDHALDGKIDIAEARVKQNAIWGVVDANRNLQFVESRHPPECLPDIQDHRR